MTDEPEVWVLVNQGPSIPMPRLEPFIGMYLEHQDVNAREGRGEARWTANLDDAQKFSSFAEAFEEWRKQSDVQPLRDDGLANRPLTAFNIEPRRIDG